jgi:hypothetical protein
VAGLLTGPCYLKGHRFKMGLTNSPTCEKYERATYILSDCEAIAYLRFRHLGHYFMEPDDYQDAPVSKVLHSIQSVGLLEGWNRGGCTIDHWWLWCKGRSRPTSYAFIHSSSSSSATSDVNLSSITFSKVCTSCYFIITGYIFLNDTPAFSWYQLSSTMLSSAASSSSLVWLKLNQHFWKQFTTVIFVTLCHDCAMKCCASYIMKQIVINHTNSFPASCL